MAENPFWEFTIMEKTFNMDSFLLRTLFNFLSAKKTLKGIEAMNMIKKDKSII